MTKVRYANGLAELKMWVTLLCKECDGKGSVEVGPTCTKPASMCCGGCYHDVKCEECDGSGMIQVNLDAEKIGELVDSLYNGYIDDAVNLITDNRDS